MRTKYYRYTLEGEQSFEEAQRTLGGDAANGMVVRVDNVGGQTHVYVARQDTGGAKSASAGGKKAAGRLKAKVVSESEVLKPL
ncbi:MAG TPA: hypothetical protein VD861_16705 [Pyrinomonadaceae bacterium]|jgi:hypothetical protein|nr:hypothetical protein [Pyrinomonadaceae bacterium]